MFIKYSNNINEKNRNCVSHRFGHFEDILCVWINLHWSLKVLCKETEKLNELVLFEMVENFKKLIESGYMYIRKCKLKILCSVRNDELSVF